MSTDDPNALIPSSQLRARYGGVSRMWVQRRLKDDPAFPRPLYIANRRFWRLGELTAWERAVAARAQPIAA
ncbi:hypothetical protein BwSF12_47210 [Bradyrhizobium ottawaense]|uniref:hypothetical protein n=1 Tax=Bradyrhizobium ottawaense TaxID=931866 RepID=UPI0027D53CF7|nr:hypothetical protein BwSH14_43710 [Bradyrhizobium ottawaense]GMO43329.1 hypothetical protein BwSF12_47210 [Bradyrhizobium ottawaense]GMO77734.1 hypothetical protein BwSF19_25030 [Bradyrhizobium ottawaense]GMO87631.1 hypothetical protein BwSH17_72280 [Bradyrhizobium ottawaense]